MRVACARGHYHHWTLLPWVNTNCRVPDLRDNGLRPEAWDLQIYFWIKPVCNCFKVSPITVIIETFYILYIILSMWIEKVLKTWLNSYHFIKFIWKYHLIGFFLLIILTFRLNFIDSLCVINCDWCYTWHWPPSSCQDTEGGCLAPCSPSPRAAASHCVMSLWLARCTSQALWQSCVSGRTCECAPVWHGQWAWQSGAGVLSELSCF